MTNRLDLLAIQEMLSWCMPALRRPDLGPCMEWSIRRTTAGYGQVNVGGRTRYAHRYVAVLCGILKGFDDPLLACHHCDNPICIEPRHLYAGDGFRNAQDCAARGRNGAQTKPETRARGARNAMTKLTGEQVLAIRKDTRTQRLIAADHGLAQSHVWRIKNGAVWKHV